MRHLRFNHEVNLAREPAGPRWIACRSQHRDVAHGDEFAIARDQIADQGGLAALARPRKP
jgi:hypothetical protein